MRQHSVVCLESLTARQLCIVARWQQHAGASWPIDMSLQLSSGLAYLHSAGIIHRDLKPANVLLNVAATKAKIADFGLSQFSNSEVGQQPFCGTVMYAAPEALADGAVGTSVDVYALGLIMYELFTGCSLKKHSRGHKG